MTLCLLIPSSRERARVREILLREGAENAGPWRPCLAIEKSGRTGGA